MGNKSTFQYVLIGVFIFLTIFGVFAFAGVIPLPKSSKGIDSTITGNIVIWGITPAPVFQAAYSAFSQKTHPKFTISYIERAPETFDADLVEAIASGKSPDAILLPQNLILRYKDKVYTIPYATFSQRAFQDLFLGEGDLFLQGAGATAIPFLIDPMVLFWNRDMLASAGIAQVPTTWDQFYTLAPQLSKYDQQLTINRSAIAFGEYRNVAHAKDVLALLIMQAGNPIVTVQEGGMYGSILDQFFNLNTSPAVAALQFYTSFSNPATAVYSWNRSLPSSKQMFLAGDLAFYFGYASEAADIRAKNPHLNFDVAVMPQPQGAKTKMTFGSLHGLALLKTSPNLNNAYLIAMRIVQPDYMQALVDTSGLPPVRRDMLVSKPTDSWRSVFYDSALIARGWYDPNPLETDHIFQTMVEAVTSGRTSPQDAAHQASVELSDLLRITNGR